MADGVELVLCHKGLIALNVYHHVPFASYLFDSFLYTVGTALVVGACHHHLTAKRFHNIIDALVVSGDISSLEHGSHLLVNMLNDRFATQQGQWFARETRRSVAGWNDSYKLHNRISLCF